jgi:hypothetical protein
MSTVSTEPAKKVMTKDHSGNENGFLIELYKDRETGNKTEAYLTAALPGAFKGYHLHRFFAYVVRFVFRCRRKREDHVG